ncbi:hypothetical protein KFL_001130010 [Klebsormidium nitens]|uniref:Uncharacterized protein n=1 Tax=Klebsormidium nitens TaxID=105231 RepID=A0A0U9HS11_KLENI|nr:hypothetical protein KFL_001130010 [Klebsormidium nitens]|eukprot:GAQ82482.1 hypothetical protein KFL_001130010 [Klebsormidium nitens]
MGESDRRIGGEAVEIFGPVGLDIGGYALTRYTGGGQACNTRDCMLAGFEFTFPPGTILTDPANTGSGAGTVVVVFSTNGLPVNGAQIALSDASRKVLDYLAYATAGNVPRTTPASVGAAMGLTPDVITTQERGVEPVGMSVQRTGRTTWSTTIGPNTFGATYQNYFTTGNANGVPVCRLLNDTGKIVYDAGGGSGCREGTQTGAYVSPVMQPPLFADGPRVIGAGALPDVTTTAALISAYIATGEHDPHFSLVGISNQDFKFDFHGQDRHSYCMITSPAIQVNVRMFGLPPTSRVL